MLPGMLLDIEETEGRASAEQFRRCMQAEEERAAAEANKMFDN